jgi:hypothetical protein
VFRDFIVSKIMSDLLAPFTLGTASASSPSSNLPDIDLDQASLPFLGSGTPFYQFYTDFLALYDAISFSHPIFAPLLLPPLALTYPIDYRQLLWADFAHVLCTVCTPVGQVVAGDLRDFLYPVEKGILGRLFRSLKSTRVLYALCASLSVTQPSPATIIGHISNPEATVASFVRTVQHPYEDLALRDAVWNFIAPAVDNEPALANLFVTGQFRVPNNNSKSQENVKSQGATDLLLQVHTQPSGGKRSSQVAELKGKDGGYTDGELDVNRSGPSGLPSRSRSKVVTRHPSAKRHAIFHAPPHSRCGITSILHLRQQLSHTIAEQLQTFL